MNLNKENTFQIFSKDSKNIGNVRLILNLKQFNEKHLDKVHFKIETLDMALRSMRKNCWFASVDLADAFYSIPVAKSNRKFLRFYFQGKKYQFTALVMVLTSSPRVFTKLLKPAFAYLKLKGHIISVPFI